MKREQLTLDLAEGERRRDAGIEATAKANSCWQDRARTALLSLEHGAMFSSDDLHAMMGDDAPRHHNSYGAAIRLFAKDGHAEAITFEKSKRPEARARVVRVYMRNAG